MEPNRPRIELILQQLDQLPTLPAVAMRVLQVASSDTSSVKELCQLIESDPALTSRILQLIHRADRGVAAEITSLERAIVMLGFDAVRCAVLAVAVLGVFQSESSAGKFSRGDFWKHCIAVGCCAELLAQACNANWGRSAAVDPSEAFVAGLLHDIGKLALDAAVPKSFAKAVEATDVLRGNIADVERNVIGVDHTIVGKRLAEQWQLPHPLRDVIWLHGQLPQALPPSVRNDRLVNLVTLADLLVREQHIGYSGNYSFALSRQTFIDALNVLPQQVDAVMARLVDAIESRARALGIGAGDASDVYRGALQQANRELSRVTDQLAARNRKLTIRAKYFEAVAAFQSELRPDAPPAVILHAIGQTAAGVLETSAVAVFSIAPGAGFAEISVVDRRGEVVQTHLVESGDVVRLGSPGAGPVQSVGADMEWLLAAFSPALSAGQRFWIGLEADAACIGGVMWGAAPGEAERLATQIQELSALAVGWSLALRTCQIRDEARALAEQLADANRQLQTAQSEIYRTKMLTSIGEIAAGAAHEMNNPLAVISGRSQLLASTLSDPRQRDAAKLIYEKSQTISDLITALMHFAKPQSPKPIAIDILSLLDSALAQAKSLSEIADRQVEVRINDLPQASVDPQQVSAALAEIVGNAIQATDASTGRLTVSASFDAMSQRLVLTIADNGCGMEEHVLRHAFDPFFSAKRAGRRQGMGLAKAQRWIESSGGTVRLESRPNEGTRAIVILPAAGTEAQTPAARMRQAT